MAAGAAAHDLTVDGIAGPNTAYVLLTQYSADGYVDDGAPAGKLGYMYKVRAAVAGKQHLHGVSRHCGDGSTAL